MPRRDAAVAIAISLIEKIRPCAFCPILRPFNRSGIVGECAVTDCPEDSPHVGIAIRFDKREYVIGATELAQVKVAGSINADGLVFACTYPLDL